MRGEIENSELFGATETERRQRLLRGGLNITTTLDLAKQSAADAAVQAYVPTDLSLKYDAPWLEGLSLKFMGSYDKFFQFVKQLMIPHEMMLAALPTTTTEKISYSSFKNNAGNSLHACRQTNKTVLIFFQDFLIRSGFMIKAFQMT